MGGSQMTKGVNQAPTPTFHAHQFSHVVVSQSAMTFGLQGYGQGTVAIGLQLFVDDDLFGAKNDVAKKLGGLGTPIVTLRVLELDIIMASFMVNLGA